MWFEQLTGFTEHGAAQVRQMLSLENSALTSHANDKVLQVGRFATPTLADLKAEAAEIMQSSNLNAQPISVQEVIADVQSLHLDPQNAGALFQVASQFNLLEMSNPTVTPDSGVSDYQLDHTQGPACAMACGAGLIYRNYFVPVNGELGQTAKQQLNMLDQFEQQLLMHVNQHHEQQFDNLWQMKNGYALPTAKQLMAINHTLAQLNEAKTTLLIDAIKIGLQYDTEVTLQNSGLLVTQAYCSAMPVAYTEHTAALWQPIASLILQAAYQATLAAAVINANRTGNKKVYLTLLGGGAFGNTMKWIIDALTRAIEMNRNSGLQVNIISYGRSKPEVVKLST